MTDFRLVNRLNVDVDISVSFKDGVAIIELDRPGDRESGKPNGDEAAIGRMLRAGRTHNRQISDANCRAILRAMTALETRDGSFTLGSLANELDRTGALQTIGGYDTIIRIWSAAAIASMRATAAAGTVTQGMK